MPQPADLPPATGEPFATTSWSLVLSAGRASDTECPDALESLCGLYWYPLYVYAKRRVRNVHEAQDLTQAFFENLLERRVISHADPQRGRFRAFLLTAFQRFLSNQHRDQQAAKRGGGRRSLTLDFCEADSRYAHETTDTQTPERVYEQQWVHVLLDFVLGQLRQEYIEKDKVDCFEQLKMFISGQPPAGTVRDAAAALQMSEGAVKVAAHRLRNRFREIMRQEIARTVESSADVDDEIRRLFQVLAEN